jgi:ESS family glutamate:Na+ symporter
MTLDIEAFGSATIAICVFFLGAAIVKRVAPLRSYSIPESVVGGLAASILIAILYYASDVKIVFDV